MDTYLNANQTDLSAFRDRAGKLLLLHGTADPIIPYTSSIRYYEQVRKEMGDVDSFFRLFLAPGMAHTFGGPGVQGIAFGLPATPKDSKHLAILALKEWVENGVAPDALYPVSFRDNNPVNGFLPDGVAYANPKPIGRDIGADYEPLQLQGGYDHNWEVYCNPCAVLEDPVSGRRMEIHTDCPGIQFYAGNFLDETGIEGVYYGKRSGVALETQYYPDALHHPEWPQPITKAGKRYHSETVFRFSY